MIASAGVAQLVRACGSYPQGPGFKSLRRHQLSVRPRALLLRALGTIRQHRLLAEGDRVIAAVSGGADSVALSWALHDLAPDLGAEVAGLVHINHGLRGDDAAADETFCRALAARMGVLFEAIEVDVRGAARRGRLSLEAAARQMRYAALSGAAARLGANAIATGHTLDDQAETVLLRLLSGAGTRGLSGVRVKRGPIVRPLLDCRRADVLRFLADRNEDFRHDASNDDRSIPRNRLRHELVPVIDRMAPGGVEAIARVAALAADDERFLMAAAASAADGVVFGGESGVQLECGPLAGLPPALGRRVVRLALERLVPRGRWSARHIEAVCRLAGAIKPAGQLDLPGVWLDRRGGRIVLGTGMRPGVAPFDIRLDVPGVAVISAAGLEIRADVAESPSGDLGAAGGAVAVLQAASVVAPLRVRSRRPGDKLKPLGAPGRRKLQDVLVDRKIPRSARDRVPVVVDATGHIVWVVGVAVSDGARVTAPEAKVIILTARPL
jgi:tRNA(Ile)-lysidine synthase